mmetsp:Transcript_62842/g.199047  ORF Transcript_62842/g.199047 Transcript_62842/m.199047 type:complete len:179 (-) Transcript_62842:3377-3913(-)
MRAASPSGSSGSRYVPSAGQGFPGPKRGAARWVEPPTSLQVAGMLPDNVVNIKDFFLKISPDQPRGEASVNFRLMNSAQNLKVRTTLQMESDVRMKETYSEMEAVNRTVPLPEPLKFERQIFITYLDDDILVARDATGSPDILVRREVYDESEPWVAPEEVDVDDKIYVTDSSDEGTD